MSEPGRMDSHPAGRRVADRARAGHSGARAALLDDIHLRT